MDLICHWCVRAFLDPTRCGNLQTPYVQAKIILPELFIILLIVISCLYFIISTITLTKLAGSLLGPFKICLCIGIFFHLKIPCMY